jgi:GntR family histidine utilization transcriptional repressor
MTVNKPRYQQLKDHIIGKISSGDLQPSDRVPSENELAQSMRVSRMTANRALRELNDEGYVERVAGRGTFVSDYRSRSDLLEVHDIADEIRRRGHLHNSRVLHQEQRTARGDVAKALHVDEGTEVFHILLIHFENDVPIQIEDRNVLQDFAPEFLEQDFKVVTPSAYLTGIAPLQEAEQVVRARFPSATVKARLDMLVDEASLLVIRRTWSEGRPVTYARLHHPGNRYELTGHYTPPGTLRTTSAEVVQLENLRR